MERCQEAINSYKKTNQSPGSLEKECEHTRKLRQAVESIVNLMQECEPKRKKALYEIDSDLIQNVLLLHAKNPEEIYIVLKEIGVIQNHITQVENIKSGLTKRNDLFGEILKKENTHLADGIKIYIDKGLKNYLPILELFISKYIKGMNDSLNKATETCDKFRKKVRIPLSRNFLKRLKVFFFKFLEKDLFSVIFIFQIKLLQKLIVKQSNKL